MSIGLLCTLTVLVSVSVEVFSSSDDFSKSTPKFQPYGLISMDTTTNPQSGNADTNKGNDIVLDMIKQVEDLESENKESKEVQKNSESVQSNDYGFENCSLPDRLDRYCNISTAVKAYFNFDTSVSGLLESIFRQDILEARRFQCLPGSWCISDRFHEDLIEYKTLFYSVSPLLSDSIWDCLEKMLEKRLACDEEPLKFLVNVVALLDDLEEVGEKKLDPHCFARTMEALYATYDEILRRKGSPPTAEDTTDCKGYTFQITKPYFCANEACNDDQKEVLKMFESWEEIDQNAQQYSKKCNISLTCQPHNDIVDHISQATTVSEDYMKEDEELEDMLKQIDKEVDEDIKEKEAKNLKNIADNDATNDKNMLIGITILTAAFMVSIAIVAFLGYRRYCRARCYQKWGYSKLVDEEAKLLRSDYS